MMITLTAEQMLWIEDHVGSGEFASVEDAVRRLLDERIAERTSDEFGDLSWMKPLVDEALAEVESGNVVTLDELKAHMRAVLASPQG